ncbi:conjugal transfer protein TraG N-terminal domain-containing protein, partial [Xanthomonas theicola]|uniref:conjugal transfer protein TraG N-terminal domain-containing protein n=1 Tax=Xanthomonas theicola TaxID=56464 RepID=UPI002012E98D
LAVAHKHLGHCHQLWRPDVYERLAGPVSVPQPADTGWSQSFSTLNNQSAKLPVWWAFMHALSRAVTGASVAAIPCGTDLRQMRMEIDATRIDDPVLAQEVADFSHDCYGPARAKLFMQRPQLDEEQMHDVTWIGSRFFTDTAGYYDSYRASTPRDDWPYDNNRDAGLAQVSSGGGYPNCRQWWADGSNGLRARLLGQVDPNLLTRLTGWAGFLSRADVDDSVIRAIASPRQQKLNQGSVYTDYGGQIDKTLPNVVNRATSDVGLAVGAIAAFPAMDVVRQALPMVLALLKMALVVCIPLVLVVGTYDIKTVVTVSVVQFALFFVDFWFQLARWIDSTILDALYGWGWGWNRPHNNFDPLVGLNNAFGDMLLNFVTGTMFLVLPTFWVAALGWVGIKAGVIAQNLAVGSKEARDSAGAGVNKVAGKVL